MLDVTKTQKKYLKSDSNKSYGKSKFVGVFEVRLPVYRVAKHCNEVWFTCDLENVYVASQLALAS